MATTQPSPTENNGHVNGTFRNETLRDKSNAPDPSTITPCHLLYSIDIFHFLNETRFTVQIDRLSPVVGPLG